jgi:hypothetical protein
MDRFISPSLEYEASKFVAWLSPPIPTRAHEVYSFRKIAGSIDYELLVGHIVYLALSPSRLCVSDHGLMWLTDTRPNFNELTLFSIGIRTPSTVAFSWLDIWV